ncbi:hypothetical protein F7P84_13385 [Edwardsiella anguillarum]|nr:hypothetical protein F7P84_13385 [Edwardsiella anguillarum]
MLLPLTAGAGSLLPTLSGCGAGTASGTVTGAGTLSAAGTAAISATGGATTGATGAAGSLLPPALKMAADHALIAELSRAEMSDMSMSAKETPSRI